MSKSFAISQEMRDEVVMTLTVRAITKAADRLQARMEKINQAFWQKHERKVEKLLGLPPTKWPELIQAGILRATSICDPVLTNKDGDTTPPEAEMHGRARKALEKHGIVGQYFTTRKYSRHQITPTMRAGKALPDFNGSETVSDKTLARRLEAATDELERIYEAATEFYGEAMAIMMGCRTSRQVEDRFPEAAKLLPKRVTDRGEIIPQEQIDRVRSLLDKGIPEAA
jgi:hypothetical protein